MEEIENVLGIRSYPMNWPIGTEGDFKGIYTESCTIELFDSGDHGQSIVDSSIGDVNDKVFADLLGDHYYNKLCEDIELLNMAGDEFDKKKILSGELTPIFFGSAMTNFGVQPFLEEFLELAPKPGIKMSSIGEVDPESNKFSGFIFKIQANMNPTHRDRIAFLRLHQAVQ
jgi:peptide chain release factor 3